MQAFPLERHNFGCVAKRLTGEHGFEAFYNLFGRRSVLLDTNGHYQIREMTLDNARC